MLLYFGYVENYALLVTAIVLYTLTGILVAQGKTSGWWLLPPLVAAIFLHLMAFTLVPSLVYLFDRKGVLRAGLSKMPARTKLLVGILLLVLAGWLYYYVYSHYHFFTFTLLPLRPDAYTVENDWLFSCLANDSTRDYVKMFLLNERFHCRVYLTGRYTEQKYSPAYPVPVF